MDIVRCEAAESIQSALPWDEPMKSNAVSSTRRVFVMSVAGCAGTLALARTAQAQAPMLAETDPQAMGLGYKADAGKVDKAKFPKYAAGQLCSNCTLYQGKAADAAGGCPLFAGKQVAGKGWCSAWVKKAG
jgi:hypothetical protein